MNVLAIDGGVTKTAAAIADRTGALTAKNDGQPEHTNGKTF